jgi:hypothetical protein
MDGIVAAVLSSGKNKTKNRKYTAKKIWVEVGQIFGPGPNFPPVHLCWQPPCTLLKHMAEVVV